MIDTSYSTAISKVLPGTFVPDVGDETPTTTPLAGIGTPQPAPRPEDQTFAATLQKFFGDVNGQLQTADQNTQDLAVGKTNDIGKVVTSVEEANLSLQFAEAVRTKLLTAYQQISQMQF